MTIPWRAVVGGFIDGYTAQALLFRRVMRVPGSQANELKRLTAPEKLAEYRAIGPACEASILELKENVLASDRRYAWAVPIVGAIELSATIAAICFLAFHNRLW